MQISKTLEECSQFFLDVSSSAPGVLSRQRFRERNSHPILFFYCLSEAHASILLFQEKKSSASHKAQSGVGSTRGGG